MARVELELSGLYGTDRAIVSALTGATQSQRVASDRYIFTFVAPDKSRAELVREGIEGLIARVARVTTPATFDWKIEDFRYLE